MGVVGTCAGGACPPREEEVPAEEGAVAVLVAYTLAALADRWPPRRPCPWRQTQRGATVPIVRGPERWWTVSELHLLELSVQRERTWRRGKLRNRTVAARRCIVAEWYRRRARLRRNYRNLPYNNGIFFLRIVTAACSTHFFFLNHNSTFFFCSSFFSFMLRPPSSCKTRMSPRSRAPRRAQTSTRETWC